MTTNFANLDHFDRAILNLVQQNNQLTHAAIGDKVSLSSSAVRRRLKVMRDAGIIERDVSILRNSGVGLRFIVTLSFHDERVETYADFDAFIKTVPEVLQSYHVSGTIDYILIVQGPNVEWYEDWGKRVFMNNPNIKRYDTHVVWSCKKFETAIPTETV
jgi:Lrp/AsnC family leucine-responsive transcriptional regulator